MENQEVYHIAEGVKEVTLIHREGLKEKEPLKVRIEGNIDSVSNWLGKRVQLSTDPVFENQNMVNQLISHVLINRDTMKISLIFNENDPYSDGKVTGQLAKHPDFTKWQINTGDSWTHQELSEFIKMNRSCFKSKADAMKLSTELANIKIKADSEYEKSNDNRGNVRTLIAQKIIESNIPKTFKLDVPVFKGIGNSEFEVEVYVNPNNYQVTLVSPDANDIVAQIKDSVINEEKAKIQGLAPELVIIEQ